MSAPTPGRWTWWTSNSWKRLKADQGHGRTVSVLVPVVTRDGHPDLTVCEADMGVIAAAREMHDVLDDLEDTFDRQTFEAKQAQDFDAPDDAEYSVNITAKQLRAISAALTKARQKP